MIIGPLALVGGDELHPGNEPQDRLLIQAAGGEPAFVVTTAAARQHPERAAENARRWFGALGLAIEELPLTTRARARSPELAARARAGHFFYLVGGDPGLVPKVLAGTASWDAMVEAWRDGAALAGSSAGAMAFGAWTLIRDRMPGDERRRYRPALRVVPGVAVVPHFDTFGQRWVGPSLDAAPDDDVILLGLDERTAAMFVDDGWWVEGAGFVSVITRARRDTFGSGEQIRGLPHPGMWEADPP